jgi:hypothetical protein
MNRVSRSLATLALGSLLSLGTAYAADQPAHTTPGQAPVLLAGATYPNGTTRNTVPDNGAIRRANPNSRQGTQSISPPVRGPSTGATPRTPTLENGGIRNGYPTRQQVPAPTTINPRGSQPNTVR